MGSPGLFTRQQALKMGHFYWLCVKRSNHLHRIKYWLLERHKLNFLLYGVKSANYDINCALFREVQTFIINTNRFSMATV